MLGGTRGGTGTLRQRREICKQEQRTDWKDTEISEGEEACM